MTTRLPLPAMPDLEALTRSGIPAITAIAPRLLGPRQAVAFYDDSPCATDPEPSDAVQLAHRADKAEGRQP